MPSNSSDKNLTGKPQHSAGYTDTSSFEEQRSTTPGSGSNSAQPSVASFLRHMRKRYARLEAPIQSYLGSAYSQVVEPPPNERHYTMAEKEKWPEQLSGPSDSSNDEDATDAEETDGHKPNDPERDIHASAIPEAMNDLLDFPSHGWCTHCGTTVASSSKYRKTFLRVIPPKMGKLIEVPQVHIEWSPHESMFKHRVQYVECIIRAKWSVSLETLVWADHLGHVVSYDTLRAMYGQQNAEWFYREYLPDRGTGQYLNSLRENKQIKNVQFGIRRSGKLRHDAFESGTRDDRDEVLKLGSL